MNKNTLLLGSAAALFVTGVQAADMPKAPAREPVYRCDTTGFIELPGTNVCFKTGGFTRFYVAAGQTNSGIAGNEFAWGGITNTAQRGDNFIMHAQARVNFDARTTSEYGAIRAFMEFQAEDGNGGTGGPLDMRHAFIQFGNWTFGKTGTILSHGDSGPDATVFQGFVGDPYSRVVQVRYTMPLGNGMSLAVAIEDPARSPGAGVATVAGPVPAGFAQTVINERDQLPAVAAALRFGGDWGSAQIAGGVRQNVVAEFNTPIPPAGAAAAAGAFASNADRDIGWRIDAGLALNLSDNATLIARGYYVDGYSTWSSIGLGAVTWNATTNTITSGIEEWMIMAGVNVTWAPQWRSSFAVSYAESDLGSAASQVEVLHVLASLFWTPVNRLDMGVEVGYIDVDDNVNGVFADSFAAVFEVTRSF